MAAAAAGIPETMLSGDADVGNLATARSLDRPTELKMTERMTLWHGVIESICGYVVRKAVEAPGGPLRTEGTVETTPRGSRRVVWNDDLPRTVDVQFPDVLEHDPEQRVRAIVSAATLEGRAPANTIPDRIVSRLLMDAIRVEDVDEALAELYPLGDATPPSGSLRVPPPPTILGPDGRPITPPAGGPPAAGGGANGHGPVPRELAAAIVEMLAREKAREAR
jgi:hypothetical protein